MGGLTVNLETLEFVIYPDGRVKETVTGIVGRSCQEVTAAIEAELGVVLTQQTTSEFFAQTSPLNQSVQQSQTLSSWPGGS
ncbi:ssl1263 [Synechocystis sp. PCC 6803]|uniref:Ssl1263 protein n=1 Tax=Synechocystis sp. (strain ATCC 27184 / PCC 6803 / Kazusa) TaxID=1111708 RepID=P74809_SYNY3|nr:MULTISPECIES: DUF2997 domain-containing protein [unclassified Synechocystis]AGF53052.1 hypothetical protein MYO_128240 [Synechocystis sp. PCC 6803]ALJ68936.1 hypothetical protein AOY38_14485 [Synechocystis sp. PCC 6803]AVP90800.1 DUF2997 domain-containing protein [Synechocystis sp. IPPAS B-1465]MBD2617908.1 DUF2997 domain-containing protein [Synechocystis sp. FACHB-898]MBD2639131.1 DUF2997 domain-containing protein [Synechocystis sp. FACHB-908]